MRSGSSSGNTASSLRAKDQSKRLSERSQKELLFSQPSFSLVSLLRLSTSLSHSLVNVSRSLSLPPLTLLSMKSIEWKVNANLPYNEPGHVFPLLSLCLGLSLHLCRLFP